MRFMEMAGDKKGLAPENLEFLMQIEYLMDQMTKAKIPLEEGYERLITLVFNHE